MSKLFKHKFYLINTETNEELWLADCRDQSTANSLADFYRELYKDSKHLLVVYRYKKIKRYLVAQAIIGRIFGGLEMSLKVIQVFIENWKREVEQERLEFDCMLNQMYNVYEDLRDKEYYAEADYLYIEYKWISKNGF